MRPTWLLPFALLAAASAPAKDKPAPAPAPADDKLVCHTTAPVGSLIATRKECRTRREWARMHVDTMRPMQGGSCNSAESGQC